MPNPLIIFENHFDPSAKQFLISNIQSLKQLGYQKILFESDHSLTKAELKDQLLQLVKKYPSGGYYKFAYYFHQLLIHLEKNNIDYSFIDPQTQQEAVNLDLAIKQHADIVEKRMLFNKKLDLMKERDKDMGQTIRKEAKMHDGGVIFIGGFSHRSLIQILAEEESNNYRYALFKNKINDAQLELETSLIDKAVWFNLANDDARAEYYQSENIHFFDMSNSLSFEVIEATCNLSARKNCHTPLAGKILNDITGQTFNFVVDEHYVVNATATLDEESLAKTIAIVTALFPGLSFFTKKEKANKQLEIVGVNLPEHMNILGYK